MIIELISCPTNNNNIYKVSKILQKTNFSLFHQVLLFNLYYLFLFETTFQIFQQKSLFLSVIVLFTLKIKFFLSHSIKY